VEIDFLANAEKGKERSEEEEIGETKQRKETLWGDTGKGTAGKVGGKKERGGPTRIGWMFKMAYLSGKKNGSITTWER